MEKFGLSHNLLFMMSLSGSTIVIAYIICHPLAKRYFPLWWRDWVLKMAVFAYLFPIGDYRFNAYDLLGPTFPQLKEYLTRSSSVLSDPFTLIISDGEFLAKWPLKVLWGSMAFTAIVALFLLGRQIFQYNKAAKKCLRSADRVRDESWNTTLAQCKAQLKIRGKIRVLESKQCPGPMTLGVFRSIIIIPPMDQLEGSKQLLVLRHELFHIKHRDLLLKFFGLAVMALHWYNPLAYFLYYEICVTRELVCDKNVIEGFPDETRQEYSNLIIDFARKETYGLFPGFSQKNIKRRILEMKSKVKTKVLLSAITMAMIGAASVVTAFAYTPPLEVEDIGFNGLPTGTLDFIPIPPEELLAETFLHDCFFTDENGNIYPVEEEVRVKRGCVHEYVSGTVTEHTKNSNGSCLVEYIEAMRCIKCGRLQCGSVINEVKYTKCPH